MESDIRNRNEEVKRGVKTAFVFMLFTIIVSQILGMILSFVPSKICQIICMVLGTVIALRGKTGPEKGSLLARKNRMTGTSFIVTLGAFMLAKLLSVLLSLLVVLVFVKDGDAAAMQDVFTEDDFLMSFLFLGIATPICEETVFRGCIGNSFKKHGIWFAMVMSSLLFALYHCNLFQLISTFLPGIVLFYVAMNYSIKWSVLFHFINNGILSIGITALKKAFPDSFAAGFAEYVIEAVLIIAALCLLKKDSAVEKVRAFLGTPENEKGVYRAAFGNIWFILLALAMILVTVSMLLMLGGNMPELSVAG